MNKKKKEKLLEISWFLIFEAIIIFTIKKWQSPPIEVIAAITGVANVYLVAQRKISNYYFGIINTSLYAIISYQNSYYGDMYTFLLYYLPLQFIGLKTWKKNLNKRTKKVKIKKLTFIKFILAVLILILGTIFTAEILKLMINSFDLPKSPNLMIDAFTTFAGIFAGILMVKGYKEQWYIWILVNIGTVSMWIILNNKLMILMWTAYLINSLYGLYKWRK